LLTVRMPALLHAWNPKIEHFTFYNMETMGKEQAGL